MARGYFLAGCSGEGWKRYLNNPGREKERRLPRWKNNPNSEAGKWSTGGREESSDIEEKKTERKESESA